VAVAVSVLLLLLFSGYLTGPITRMVTAMQEIIHHHNFSERVRVEYKDEIGTLAHTFNVTINELENSYIQIKNFALEAVLAVLFSDIRGFTTLTELMRADQMVQSLNSYFSPMVDKILDRNGIVDKYIGDAIMAFFGAPVQHTDDAFQAVLTALEMQEALVEFNE